MIVTYNKSVFSMVRFYKKKTERCIYGLNNINQAVEAVSSGAMSKRKAEAVFGVPRRTLGRHLQELVIKPGKLGRYECALGEEVEEVLSKHIVTMQQTMFGFSTGDIRKLAYDIACANGLKHPFSTEKKKAGKDWLMGYLKRHPEISLRTPEPTSMSRAVSFNRANVQKFYDIYKEQLDKDSYTADRIWNMDETGFTAVHKPARILAKCGAKQVGRITSGEKGVTTTAICAVSAGGVYIPPMLIYKRKRMTDVLLKGSSPGTIGGCSENGWVTSELFVKWLKHFVEHAKPSKERSLLLLVDGHSSHKSLPAIDYARSQNIIMICFPPHSTHRMQPLDRTVYGPLKAAYNRECDKWMSSHVGQRISPYDVAQLFGTAYVNSATMRNAISGFSCTGLWPFNPDVFTDEDFSASMITEEEDPSAVQASATTKSTSPAVEGPPVDSPAVVEPPVAAVSTSPAVEGPAVDSPAVVKPPPATVLTPSAVEGTAVEPQPATLSISRAVTLIQHLSPLPHISKPRVRKRAAESADVLTSSPFKKRLLEKAARKDSKSKPVHHGKRKEKKAKKQKKKTCREDKRRGKCNMVKQLQSTVKKVKQTRKKDRITKTVALDDTAASDTDDRVYHCLMCSEQYIHPPTETWIQCRICNGWCHEACTAGEGSRGFVCDFRQ